MGESSNITEAVVLIKAAPHVGKRHGETVCCAALDAYGKWLRLYPIKLRVLDDQQKFARWDRIKFRWRAANDDSRVESRRVEQDSIEIVGQLKGSERGRFLAKSIVTGLKGERDAGRSLALLKPEFQSFSIQRKDDKDLRREEAEFEEVNSQSDLFAKRVRPYRPCPYEFKYKYKTEDGDREGTCQDWEVEATYFNWVKRYGEKETLEKMAAEFGERIPQKGMLFAMGTHSRYPDVWLINGIIRQDELAQLTLI
ncbi:MAG: hypothetical protein U1E67_23015 [Hyphomicrobiales bacterium]